MDKIIKPSKLENEVETPPTLTKAQKRKKIILLLAGLIAFNAFVFGALYLSIYRVEQQEKKVANSVNKLSELVGVEARPSPAPSAKPTPIPFKEMTIPHLRSRGYSSNLSNLEQVSQSENYTAYLTNYDSDGYRVNGLLTIPTGEKPSGGWPSIVFVHGYIPPQSYQTQSNYASYVDYLARNGFVVFKIDLRGHGQSEGDPSGAYFSGDYIVDVLNARAALQKADFVNKNKIGLWGHSMAGNVVSRALAAQPNIPAIVIWAGAVYTYEDFYEYRIQDSSYQPPATQSERVRERERLFQAHGTFEKNSSFWKSVPMTNYLDDIKGAIQINHAVDDGVVSINYSRNLNKILDSTKVEHELNEYPSGGHNITGASFNQSMQNTVNFFNKHLN